jgi:hypothetical protein
MLWIVYFYNANTRQFRIFLNSALLEVKTSHYVFPVFYFHECLTSIQALFHNNSLTSALFRKMHCPTRSFNWSPISGAALQRRSDLCIPRKESARPCSQFPNSFVIWAIYIFPRLECRNGELGRAVSFLGKFVSNFWHSVFAVCAGNRPRARRFIHWTTPHPSYIILHPDPLKSFLI